eukprot:scaffold85476_cov39-Phaeocystis_antarctica.AAC.1
MLAACLPRLGSGSGSGSGSGIGLRFGFGFGLGFRRACLGLGRGLRLDRREGWPPQPPLFEPLALLERAAQGRAQSVRALCGLPDDPVVVDHHGRAALRLAPRLARVAVTVGKEVARQHRGAEVGLRQGGVVVGLVLGTRLLVGVRGRGSGRGRGRG